MRGLSALFQNIMDKNTSLQYVTGYDILTHRKLLWNVNNFD